MYEKEAINIQGQLRKKICLKDVKKKIKKVAGIDCSYSGKFITASIVICKYPDLSLIEEKVHSQEVQFPYIPGFLAFREGPAILNIIKKTKNKPDIIFLNGHGIAHPKGIGLATHIGILIKKSTIGCAKKILFGNYKKPSEVFGSYTFIENNYGEKIGYVLRTFNKGIIFISPGNMISLKTTLSITLSCLKKNFSFPYPLYLAHTLSKQHCQSKL